MIRRLDSNVDVREPGVAFVRTSLSVSAKLLVYVSFWYFPHQVSGSRNKIQENNLEEVFISPKLSNETLALETQLALLEKFDCSFGE